MSKKKAAKPKTDKLDSLDLDELLAKVALETDAFFESLPASKPETREQRNRRHFEQARQMLSYCKKTGNETGIKEAEKILRLVGAVKQPDGTWALPGETKP